MAHAGAGRLLRVLTGVVFGSALLLVAGLARANLISNGDFEDNTANATIFNMTNSTFNATVADATSFGEAAEIDLVRGVEYGIAPHTGQWKLGLHQNEGSPTYVDAFSFDLSESVIAGNSYVLGFWAAGLHDDDPSRRGPVEIGLSSSSTSFGTLIFSGTPTSATSWSQFNHAFVAPVDAAFLTVSVATQPNMYAFVDTFSLDLVSVPEPSTAFLLAAGLAGLALQRRWLS